jgi:hypothetical protein
LIAFVLFLAVMLFLLVGKAARGSRQGGWVGGRQRVLEAGRLAVQGRSLTRKAVEWAVAGDPAAACEFPQHSAVFPQHCALFPQQIPARALAFQRIRASDQQVGGGAAEAKNDGFPSEQGIFRNRPGPPRGSSAEQGLVDYERR